MPDQIFEAFVRIGDDLTMNNDKYLQLIERSMLHDNTCPLLFVIILLKNSVHSIDLQSKLFYWFLHNRN